MKLPALWVVAAFGTGIAISWRLALAPKIWIAGVPAALILAGILLWRAR